MTDQVSKPEVLKFYETVWIKEHGSDPRGDWPFRFAEAYAKHYAASQPSVPRSLTEALWELICACDNQEQITAFGGLLKRRIAEAREAFRQYALTAPSQTESQGVPYWKSRAETAELKILTFHEEIAKLSPVPSVPATETTQPDLVGIIRAALDKEQSRIGLGAKNQVTAALTDLLAETALVCAKWTTRHIRAECMKAEEIPQELMEFRLRAGVPSSQGTPHPMTPQYQLAFEMGYKACERGLNIQAAVHEFAQKVNGGTE